jgi:hypothetical protein
MPAFRRGSRSGPRRRRHPRSITQCDSPSPPTSTQSAVPRGPSARTMCRIECQTSAARPTCLPHRVGGAVGVRQVGNGEARLLLAAAADAVARGVPALLARDPRPVGAAPRRRASHPPLRADAHARPSPERRAGRGTQRARGVRRRRRAVVGQPRRPRRRHRDARRASRRPGAARGRAPLHPFVEP